MLWCRIEPDISLPKSPTPSAPPQPAVPCQFLPTSLSCSAGGGCKTRLWLWVQTTYFIISYHIIRFVFEVLSLLGIYIPKDSISYPDGNNVGDGLNPWWKLMGVWVRWIRKSREWSQTRMINVIHLPNLHFFKIIFLLVFDMNIWVAIVPIDSYFMSDCTFHDNSTPRSNQCF